MNRICFSGLVALIGFGCQARCAAELIRLEIVPGTFPMASSVAASIDGGIIGSDDDQSRVSGFALLDVDSLSAPISEAEIVELSLVLDDGFSFRLGLGALVASAAPGAIVATMTEPGTVSPVMDGKFDQRRNLMALQGEIDVSIDPEPLDLSAIEPQPIDIEGVTLGFQDDRLTAEIGVDLLLEYEVEDVPVFGSIPISIELSGTAFAISDPIVATLRGDFDGDGVVGFADINTLSAAVRIQSADLMFDLDNNGKVEFADREVWVETIANTYFGDANLDGEFNSSDFVLVFRANEYQDDVVGNSVWETGDWNGDGDFDSSDFVAAFQSNAFEKGPRPAVVPEPRFSACVIVVAISLLARVFSIDR